MADGGGGSGGSGSSGGSGVGSPVARPSLSVGTWNIHAFADGDGRDAVDRMIETLKKCGADVVGLEEVTGEVVTGRGGRPTRALLHMALEAGYPHVQQGHLSGLGQAVISKYPILRGETLILDGPGTAARKARAAIAALEDGDSSTNEEDRALEAEVDGWETRQAVFAEIDGPIGRLVVVAVHLDHVHEALRLRQLRVLRRGIRRFCRHGEEDALPHVLVGDFNALLRHDYTATRWDAIRRERARGGWPPPRSSVMAALIRAENVISLTEPIPPSTPLEGEMKDGGLEIAEPHGKYWDAGWVARSASSGPSTGTSRFRTRIDYVLLRSVREELRFVPGSYRVIDAPASDHNIALARVERTPEE